MQWWRRRSSGVRGAGLACQVAGGRHGEEAHVAAERNGDHVQRHVLGEADAGVKALRPRCRANRPSVTRSSCTSGYFDRKDGIPPSQQPLHRALVGVDAQGSRRCAARPGEGSQGRRPDPVGPAGHPRSKRVPASVTETLRVVRLSNRTPRRCSRLRSAWLKPERETPRASAAWRKLRCSATAAKAASSSRVGLLIGENASPNHSTPAGLCHQSHVRDAGKMNDERQSKDLADHRRIFWPGPRDDRTTPGTRRPGRSHGAARRRAGRPPANLSGESQRDAARPRRHRQHPRGGRRSVRALGSGSMSSSATPLMAWSVPPKNSPTRRSNGRSR